MSLNDTLLVGPTVHASLVDVLLRFRQHRVALIADVSRMYRAVALPESDRDMHRFVWRTSPNDHLKDYRMTRVTFGVSSSAFIANMCIKQNAIDHASQFPQAAEAVHSSFYVDDGLTGADSVEQAIELHNQLQMLFDAGGFLLRKWNSSETAVLENIEPKLRDVQHTHTIIDSEAYTKTLGVEWYSNTDKFRLIVADLVHSEVFTKRELTSDIAKVYDPLGWIAPVTIKAKILLQRLWEEKIQWDDQVPEALLQIWLRWRTELKLLTEKNISRCYFPKDATIIYQQIHGFSDASELAYAAVVYLRQVDSTGTVHIALVAAKTKVAPIKRQSIPRLELCGAGLLAQLLHHCQITFKFPLRDTFAWTDSTIVLNWLAGNPRRFKAFVGNRVSQIIDLVPPNRWHFVEGIENPADCASRGLYGSELLTHKLWWSGPQWLTLGIHHWPKQPTLSPNNLSEEADEICAHTAVLQTVPSTVIPMDQYSSYTQLKRITAWIRRFVKNCQTAANDRTTGPLTAKELEQAQNYWIVISQRDHFSKEINLLSQNKPVSKSSSLRSLHPFIDQAGIIHVGGRQQNSNQNYNKQHPVILHGKHIISKLIVSAEHLRLLHAGPLLMNASLRRRFHFLGGRRVVRFITRSCVICKRQTARAHPPPLMGQLPAERITPDIVFSHVGIDYAGPLLTKFGYVRKPTLKKAYVCVFVSLSTKAVHLELVSDLTTEAFIACLRRFVARRGKPTNIWSDHGTNFIGAARQLNELYTFLKEKKTTEVISRFCSDQSITWDFIPEHVPHFGGLWEAAVKSFKRHLYRIMGDTKLTFEEMTTTLTQIEACLNSRPLTPLPTSEDANFEVLTLGHFLIGRPLEALPDCQDVSLQVNPLKRWHLCQTLIRHFWNRWSTEYITNLQRMTKWQTKNSNLAVGDVVIVQEKNSTPTRWPIARIIAVYPGRDGVVRVVDVKTATGTYTRPSVKIIPLSVDN